MPKILKKNLLFFPKIEFYQLYESHTNYIMLTQLLSFHQYQVLRQLNLSILTQTLYFIYSFF